MATKKNGSMDISNSSNQDENTHKPRKPKRMSAETPAQPTVIGIGASAGGLSALKRLFERVPRDSGVAFVVVVHLSPEHKSELAGLLQRSSAIPVQQVQEDLPLHPNTVYVIPPGRKLSTIDSHLRLEPMEPERSKRAPIDHFFRTLTASHDSNSVGIVLTGTGSGHRFRRSAGCTGDQRAGGPDYRAIAR